MEVPSFLQANTGDGVCAAFADSVCRRSPPLRPCSAPPASALLGRRAAAAGARQIDRPAHRRDGDYFGATLNRICPHPRRRLPGGQDPSRRRRRRSASQAGRVEIDRPRPPPPALTSASRSVSIALRATSSVASSPLRSRSSASVTILPRLSCARASSARRRRDRTGRTAARARRGTITAGVGGCGKDAARARGRVARAERPPIRRVLLRRPPVDRPRAGARLVPRSPGRLAPDATGPAGTAAASASSRSAASPGATALVVLDNRRAPASTPAPNWRQRCSTARGRSRCFATSREPLGVEGEQVFRCAVVDAALCRRRGPR